MMDAAKRISRAEGLGSWRLWVGLLTGPAAWALQVLVNYSVEEIACAPATRQTGEIWGFSTETIILIVNVVLAAATVLAGILAYRCLREIGEGDDEAHRATWMARTGIMSSILFLIAIGLGFAPQWFLGVCEIGL